MVKCFTKKKNDGSNYTACVDFNKKTKKTTKPKSKLKGKTITIKKTKKPKSSLKKSGITIKRKPKPKPKPKPTAKGVMTIQKKIKTTKKLKNKSTIKAPLTKSKVKPRASTKSYFQLYKDTEAALRKSRLYAWNHRSPYDKGRDSTSGDFPETAAGLKKAIAFRKKVLTKVKKMKAGVIDLLNEYNKEHKRVKRFASPRALSSLHFDIEDKLITSAEAFIRLNSWEKYDKYTDTDAHMFHHKNRIMSIVRMKTNKYGKKGDLSYMKQNGPNGSWSATDRP
mgnify:CR=1 FL=1